MDGLKLKVLVSTELNEFDKNDIRITSNKDNSFQLRIGYWEKLDYNIIKKLQDKFHIHISEELFEDEDCGNLYGYTCYWELSDIDDTDFFNDDDDLEEMEFLHRYESDMEEYLDWVVDNKIDVG